MLWIDSWGEALRNPLQEFVAGFMPELVVDAFEPVQIEQLIAGSLRSAATSLRKSLGDAVGGPGRTAIDLVRPVCGISPRFPGSRPG